jgi:hypothetical protein
MGEQLEGHWNNYAGFYGWGALALTVVALDVALPQTLSVAADRMLENTRTRAIPWLVGGVVAGHVLNVLPSQFDPIQRVADYAINRSKSR